ncbi:MAG TPA: hypothetical protein VLR49_04605, partial [Ferruginibacter sp.]|nr:hypothetical protein [Ferruginibacter sp.]
MKKDIVATILFLAMLNSSFGQETKNVNRQLTREDYLKKSKNQKITALVLLGAGLASFIIVAPGNSSFETTGTVVVIGRIAVLSSIPLFI